jgi:hypothetical protein
MATKEVVNPDLEALRAQYIKLQAEAVGEDREATQMLKAIADALSKAEAARKAEQEAVAALSQGGIDAVHLKASREAREAVQKERDAAARAATQKELVAKQQVETALAGLCAATASALDAVAEAETLRNTAAGIGGGNIQAWGALRARMAGRIAFQLRNDGKLGVALEHSTMAAYMTPLVTPKA